VIDVMIMSYFTFFLSIYHIYHIYLSICLSIYLSIYPLIIIHLLTSLICREKLKEYWQRVIGIEKVTDFTKHHCNYDLKVFLVVEVNIMNKVRQGGE
jgi:hypothetical protein